MPWEKLGPLLSPPTSLLPLQGRSQVWGRGPSPRSWFCRQLGIVSRAANISTEMVPPGPHGQTGLLPEPQLFTHHRDNKRDRPVPCTELASTDRDNWPLGGSALHTKNWVYSWHQRRPLTQIYTFEKVTGPLRLECQGLRQPPGSLSSSWKTDNYSRSYKATSWKAGSGFSVCEGSINKDHCFHYHLDCGICLQFPIMKVYKIPSQCTS